MNSGADNACDSGLRRLVLGVAETSQANRHCEDETSTVDSEGWRSAFRTDVDHDSEVMPISVLN